MTTKYVTEVGEVRPGARCKCGDAAELHEVVRSHATSDAEEDAEQYYDACTVQGCGCLCFEEEEG